MFLSLDSDGDTVEDSCDVCTDIQMLTGKVFLLTLIKMVFLMLDKEIKKLDRSRMIANIL